MQKPASIYLSAVVVALVYWCDWFLLCGLPQGHKLDLLFDLQWAVPHILSERFRAALNCVRPRRRPSCEQTQTREISIRNHYALTTYQSLKRRLNKDPFYWTNDEMIVYGGEIGLHFLSLLL